MSFNINATTNNNVIRFMERFGETPDVKSMRPEGAGPITPEEVQEYLLRAGACNSAAFMSHDPSVKREQIEFAAAKFIELVDEGKVNGKVIPRHERQLALRQAMSYANFPQLFGYVLDRQVLPMFERRTDLSDVLRIAHVTTLTDFKTVERHARAGGRGEYKIQPEGGPAEADGIKSFYKTYRPYLYSKKFNLTMQSFINDDVGIFDDLVDRIVDSALTTYELFVTRLIADSSGWLASAFIGDTIDPDTGSGTSGAAIGGGSLGGTANDPVSESAVEDGFQIMGDYQDRGNQVPINMVPDIIMIAPGNQLNTRSLLRSVNVIVADMTNAADTVRGERNKVGGLMDENSIVVNGHLPLVASSANAARKKNMWALFKSASPGMKFIEIGGLQDFNTPRIFAKNSDQSGLDGGQMPWTFGDFDTNTAQIKGMIGFGGAVIDPECGYANNGAASP